MRIIYIDADACPVKKEVYRVARRYGLRVAVVANTPLQVPADDQIELVVRPGFGGADDWIAEQTGPGDIVITADISLASRSLAKEARVLDPKGRAFTDNDIGGAVATRHLMEELRQSGTITPGQAPMQPKDRSRFLAKLDDMVNAVNRSHPASAGSRTKGSGSEGPQRQALDLSGAEDNNAIPTKELEA